MEAKLEAGIPGHDDDPRCGDDAPTHEKIGPTAPKSKQSVGKLAQKRIGTHLRAMYQDVLDQPVPPRFSDLIASLDDGASGASGGKKRPA